MTRKIQKLRLLRPEALSLLLVLASSAAWTLSTPGPLDRFGTLKGTDFSQFYVAGRLVVTGRSPELYDWSVFAHALASWVPGPEGLLYLSVYPPTLGLLLAPLGLLEYVPALVLWTVISAGLYLASGALLVQRTPRLAADPVSSYLLLASFPAFAQLLLFGQISAIPLALVTLGWLAWRSGRPLVTGLALGALVLKPQMLAITAVAVLLLGSWPLAAGAALGAAIELGLTALIVGPMAMAGYAGAVQRVLRNPAAFEPKAEQIQSVRGFFMPFAASGVLTSVLTALASIAVIVLAAKAARRLIASPDLRFAIVVLAGALVNPHLYVYDLVVLVVPLALVTGWLIEEREAGIAHRAAAIATRTLYWLPLVAPVLGLLRVQLMAPAMVWLLWALGSGVPARPTENR